MTLCVFPCVRTSTLSALSRCVFATDMSLPDLRAARPDVGAQCQFLQFLYVCTSKASKLSTACHHPQAHFWMDRVTLEALRCASGVTICTFVLVFVINFYSCSSICTFVHFWMDRVALQALQSLRCQYLYFCTSKASTFVVVKQVG